MEVGLIAIIAISLFFDYTNGFHDAANAVATSISTRALTPRVALIGSAVLNLLGALVSTKVASTVGKGIIPKPVGTHGLVVVAAAVLGAIAWNLITWYFGLPSSSTHALIGGLVGAGIASSTGVKWHGVLEKVVIPMVVSPLIAVPASFLLMTLILWVFRRARPRPVNRGFRHAQIASAAWVSWTHGLQDAQKTMGVITLALVTAGHQKTFVVPFWVKVAAAIAIGLGTWSGGWRVIRTLGRRVIQIDPPRGFAAETTSGLVLYIAGIRFGAPVSTTHVVTSSVMGVGATKSLSAVRWGVARSIVAAWVLTIPAAAIVAAAVYGLLHLFLP